MYLALRQLGSKGARTDTEADTETQQMRSRLINRRSQREQVVADYHN